MDTLTSSEFWVGLLQVVGIDIVMSGDNAVVIALAARNLKGRQRRTAVVFGSLGAVILRILLTVIAARLLTLSYLQTVGSFLLLWVAYRLVLPTGRLEKGDLQREHGLIEAVWAITIADVVMSLDNILGLAAVARGNWVLLTIGLAISIFLIVVGSSLLLRLMTRYPVIVIMGGALLGYVAGGLLLSDPIWHSMEWLGKPWIHNSLPMLFAAVIALFGMRRRA